MPLSVVALQEDPSVRKDLNTLLLFTKKCYAQMPPASITQMLQDLLTSICRSSNNNNADFQNIDAYAFLRELCNKPEDAHRKIDQLADFAKITVDRTTSITDDQTRQEILDKLYDNPEAVIARQQLSCLRFVIPFLFIAILLPVFFIEGSEKSQQSARVQLLILDMLVTAVGACYYLYQNTLATASVNNSNKNFITWLHSVATEVEAHFPITEMRPPVASVVSLEAPSAAASELVAQPAPRSKSGYQPLVQI